MSYADIARATINISHNPALNMSTIVPSILNVASWPSVPPKIPSELDKAPQDYYPSLDEIQHSERRMKQNSSHSNHATATSLNLPFEKPPSPILAKAKNSSDGKKAEAQEEAINKNIQVFKYVQDIEKMQSLTQEEQKHLASNNNHSANSNDTVATNPVIPKLNNNTGTYNNPVDADNNTNCTFNNKDSVTHARANNPRSRRSYVHNNQNIQSQGSYEEQHVKKTTCSFQDEAGKKLHNIDAPQAEVTIATITLHDSTDTQKLKAAKPTQESQSADADGNNKTINSEPPRSTRVVKEYQNTTLKHDVVKAGVCQLQNSKQDNQREDTESKKTKSQSLPQLEKDQSQRSLEMPQTKNSTSRPAVILLDETSSDVANNNSLPTELTFGFEINEQLLLSEDSGNEETSIESPVFSSAIPPSVNKTPPNFAERNPPAVFEKPVRYDKFSSNYHMQQSPNAHVTPPPAVHPVMVQPLPYMSYTTRFPPPTYMSSPSSPSAVIVEKFHQPKEDFSMLYVAPEEELNVQTYNHDKIVSFVGLGKTNQSVFSSC